MGHDASTLLRSRTNARGAGLRADTSRTGRRTRAEDVSAWDLTYPEGEDEMQLTLRPWHLIAIGVIVGGVIGAVIGASLFPHHDVRNGSDYREVAG